MFFPRASLRAALVRWLPKCRWPTNLCKVQIEITSFCNLACFNCDRSVRRAPTRESMSVAQIGKFVSESLEAAWKWKRITLLGGEPTLHPQLFEILAHIEAYKVVYPDCVVEIATNGYGDRVKNVLSGLPRWVQVDNSAKQSNRHSFFTYNVAPVDVATFRDADFSKGCWITSECGLGLTRNGYYPCGAGGSVDRVFGFGVGRKRLALVTREALLDQRRSLCRYCGHFKTNLGVQRVDHEVVSASWEKAYEAYGRKRPVLALY
jgi:hypothetical protein